MYSATLAYLLNGSVFWATTARRAQNSPRTTSRIAVTTMNPSTEDILEAIGQTPAHNVFVLPNNKNIIMAAEQAVSLADRNVCGFDDIVVLLAHIFYLYLGQLSEFKRFLYRLAWVVYNRG